MKISFDLDNTLICSPEQHPYEDVVKFPYTLFFKERLRKGIINLVKDLIDLGYEIYIYTTSERSIKYIKKLFKLHGININKIINRFIHEKIVQANHSEIMPSKVPSKFGIDLHIDDDITVKQNGIQYGFNVLIITPTDRKWDQLVLQEAIRIKKLKRSFMDYTTI